MKFRNRNQTVTLGCLAMLSTAMYLIWVGELSAAKPWVKCLDAIRERDNNVNSSCHNGQTGVGTKKSLPNTAIDPSVWLKFPGKKWHGLQLPLITSSISGDLGNIMGEYASILAVGRVYNVTVRMIPVMRDRLINYFPNLTIPLLPVEFKKSEWTPANRINPANDARLEASASGILGPGRFILYGSALDMHLFDRYRQDIKKEFTFTKKVQEQVLQFWKKKLGNNTSSVRIGIHVRRGDYVGFNKHYNIIPALPGDAYFKRATDYYRAKFKDVLFVVASDDMGFVKNAFANHTDVMYTAGTPRELDMAIMASCNHSIMTVGSFGFWCAYLSGGEVVYPNITAIKYPHQESEYKRAQIENFTALEPY